MLKRFTICDGKITESDAVNGDILVYIKPTEEEKNYLVTELKLDEHTLASALDPDEPSRLEFEPDHIAIIFKRPRAYSEKYKYFFRVFSVGLFLFADKIIILEGDDLPLFEGKLFSKVQSLQEIVIKLIFRSIHQFLDNLKLINAMSSSLEEKIHVSMQNRYIMHMLSLEKSLVYYLNAIGSNTLLIEKLKLHASKIRLTQEVAELLDDLMVENNQCYEQAKIYSEILSNTMDAWVSIVSNNLNIVMKTLTIITLAVMVPTFVVSAFSMNVPLPISQNDVTSFWIVMSMSGFSLLVVLVVWWLKKW